MNSLIVSIGKLPEWRSLLAGWCRPDQTGIPNSHHLATWLDDENDGGGGNRGVVGDDDGGKGYRDSYLQVIMCGRQVYHGIDRETRALRSGGYWQKPVID